MKKDLSPVSQKIEKGTKRWFIACTYRSLVFIRMGLGLQWWCYHFPSITHISNVEFTILTLNIQNLYA